MAENSLCDPNDPFSLTDEQVLERIESLTAGLMAFWKDVYGWAPVEAADLLNGSMLEWQTSLATSLKRWVKCTSEGDLILAWTNLGSLAEGALKLFLCAYFLHYLHGSKASIETKGKQKGKSQAQIEELKANISAPDGLALEGLKVFFAMHVWDSKAAPHLYLADLQTRRNAVHAFQKKEIGSFADFKRSIRHHLLLLRNLNDRLPYPDEEFRPTEKGWIIHSLDEDPREPIILKKGQGLVTTTIRRNNKVVSHKVEVVELSDILMKEKH